MFKKTMQIILIMICFGFTNIAAAQITDNQTAGQQSEGLTISPPVVEINLEPGNSYQKTVKITNPTNNIVELYPIAMNFGAKDETGTPGFSPAEDDSKTFSMAKWIKLSAEKIALTSQQVVDFAYTIEVPTNTEPGGHYGVLFFSTKPPTLSQDQSQVAISSQVGVLILGKVAGEIKEEGSVEEFSVAKKFYLKAPVDLIARIKNLGNIHFKPKGDIIIKNIFGSEIGKIAFNEKLGNVLPDSIRKFDIAWNPDQSIFYKIPIGKFTANLASNYGGSNQNLTAQASFWIIPVWFMVVVGVIILLIIFLIIWGKRKKNKDVSLPKKDKDSENIKITDYSKNEQKTDEGIEDSEEQEE